MSKYLKFECDRCDVVDNILVRLETMIPPDTQPVGWQIVNGKLICDACGIDLGNFLSGSGLNHEAVIRKKV